jgi:hypothetical protein
LGKKISFFPFYSFYEIHRKLFIICLFFFKIKIEDSCDVEECWRDLFLFVFTRQRSHQHPTTSLSSSSSLGQTAAANGDINPKDLVRHSRWTTEEKLFSVF